MYNLKPTHTLCLLFLFFFIFISCKETPNGATIKLDLKYIKTASFEINDLLTFNTTPYESLTFDSLQKTLNIDFDEPIFGNLILGEAQLPVYLENEHQLSIQKSDDPNVEFEYTGKGSEFNIFLQKIKTIENQFFEKRTNIYTLTTLEFRTTLDSLHSLISTLEVPNLTADKIQLAKKISEIRTSTYHLNHFLVSRDTSNYTDDFLLKTTASLNHLDLLKAGQPDYAVLLHFYLEGIIYRKVNQLTSSPKENSIKDFYKSTHTYLSNIDAPEIIKEVLMAKNLTSAFFRNGINPNSSFIYNSFKNQFSNSKYLHSLKQTYDDLVKLKSNKTASDIIGNTADGNEMSLSELEGNIIFIDIWATWCKPCIEEFPATIELSKKYNDQVKFVYFSIDKDTSKWKKFLTTHPELNGIHLLDQAENSILQLFEIEGIPRYILIDAEGVIVNSHAPNPSSGELEAMFEELL